MEYGMHPRKAHGIQLKNVWLGRPAEDRWICMFTLTTAESERKHKLTDSGNSISGGWMPGPQLLDIIKMNQSSPGPGPRCEVIISGTNYLSVRFIAACHADAELVVATLPHRYDLDPDLSVHDDTFLSAKLGGIGRKFFTRDGQHLTMRGKWLLARMICRVASERPLKTASTPDQAILTVTSSPTISQEPPIYQAFSRFAKVTGRTAV
ncbi:hypothetical protein J6590_082347 [Homalodisca vitripennis]|nr:hypothetical protein J6590_082347 [Homalodisca vitripennis]